MQNSHLDYFWLA